jgi:hypothetical protein
MVNGFFCLLGNGLFCSIEPLMPSSKMKRQFMVEGNTLPDIITAEELEGFFKKKLQDPVTISELLKFSEERRANERVKVCTVRSMTRYSYRI